MGLFDWLKPTAAASPRQAPEAVFADCLRERGTTGWNKTDRDGVGTFGVIRSIEFTENMAHASLLVPRDSSMIEVPCDKLLVPIKTRAGWRVAAYRGMGLTGPSKLVKGTIDLQVGDMVMVNLTYDSRLGADTFRRTSDGWTAQMLGKFLSANGYQMGDLYYFKGPSGIVM